ncbi:MAG: integrin alpha [Planctomycetota bacterium]
MIRSTILAGLGLLAPVAAQPPLSQLNGSAGAQFGRAVAAVGDLDGDGHAEVLVGAPIDSTSSPGAGAAFLYSGATGTVLRTVLGAVADDGLGAAVAGLGDVDGDGVPDYAIAAPGDDTEDVNAGSVLVISGADGSTLHRVDGETAGDALGTAVAAAGDVDADGYADVLIGVPGDDRGGVDAGAALAISGRTGATLHEILGPAAGDALGAAVAAAGDLNADGYDDLLLGAPGTDGAVADTGAIRVYSGLDSAVLLEVLGIVTDDAFGAAVAGIGDTNGDGTPDLAVGIPGDDRMSTDAGAVNALSGADGATLWSVFGSTDIAALGTAVAGAGDADGDGIGDVVAGAPRDARGGPGTGSAAVYSGADGCQLLVRIGPFNGAQLGQSVSGGPTADINGDRRPDVVAGGPALAVQNPNGVAEILAVPLRDGYAQTHLLTPAPAAARFGIDIRPFPDLDGDSIGDYLIGAAFDAPERRGSVRIYSGATHTEIHKIIGPSPGDSWFGHAIGNAGDVDLDGFDDIIVGSYHTDVDPLISTSTEEGRAEVISGNPALNFASIYTFIGPSFRAHMGSAVGGLGDVDGDSVDDFFAGLGLVNNEEGELWVFSGATGTQIPALTLRGTFTAEPSAEWFGWSAAAIGDIDGDGLTELAIGAPSGQVKPQPGNGYVDVYSLANGGTLLYRWQGSHRDELFGWTVEAAGDVNADGTPDVLVGGYQYNNGNVQGAGRAQVFSGADGSVLHSVVGTRAGARVGEVVGAAGDVDGDGHDDFLVGAPFEWPCGVANAGEVRLYSGRTGQVMQVFEGNGLIDLYRVGVGLGDLNGDGRPELAIGGDFAPVTTVAGEVRIYESGPFALGWAGRYGGPCSGSDGRLPRIGADAPPRLGQTLTATLRTAVPAAGAALVAGATRTAFPMGPAFAPGCTLLVVPLATTTTTTDANGDAQLAVPLPASPSLIGGAIYLQWLVVDAPANPLGLAFSDGLDLTIGS